MLKVLGKMLLCGHMKNLLFILSFCVSLIACSPGTPSASSNEVQELVIGLVKESLQDASTSGYAEGYDITGVDDITYKSISAIGDEGSKKIIAFVDEDFKDIELKLDDIVLVSKDDDLKLITAKATVLGASDPFDINYTAQRTEKGDIRVEVW